MTINLMSKRYTRVWREREGLEESHSFNLRNLETKPEAPILYTNTRNQFLCKLIFLWSLGAEAAAKWEQTWI